MLQFFVPPCIFQIAPERTFHLRNYGMVFIGVVAVIAFFFASSNHNENENSGILLVDGGASNSKTEEQQERQKEVLGYDELWSSLPLITLLNAEDNVVVEWSKIAEAPTESLGALAEQCGLAALLLDVMRSVVKISVSGTAPNGIYVEKVLDKRRTLLYAELWEVVPDNRLLPHLELLPARAARVALLALFKRIDIYSMDVKVPTVMTMAADPKYPRCRG